MQTQKEEIKSAVIEAAKNEFLKRGFKDSSMRTIAKKANTSLGNLYNYYKNKEAILDEVVGDIPSSIDALLEKHRKQSYEDWPQYLEQMDRSKYLDEIKNFDLFLSTEFVIMMEGCEHTKYEHYKDKFMEVLREHLTEHMEKHFPKHLVAKDDIFLIHTLGHSFYHTLLFIAKNKTNMQQGRENLLKYLIMLIDGHISKKGDTYDSSR